MFSRGKTPRKKLKDYQVVNPKDEHFQRFAIILQTTNTRDAPDRLEVFGR